MRSILVDRLTEREATQMYLDILHQNTAQTEEAYMASIRANVKQKWIHTARFIINTRHAINATHKETACA
jgi:hypothetical protein